MYRVLKRVINCPLQFGGVEHTGWLPPGAATPLPTPIENVSLDIEVGTDGHGYFLAWTSADSRYCNDNWYETLAGAEEAAIDLFCIEADDWREP